MNYLRILFLGFITIFFVLGTCQSFAQNPSASDQGQPNAPAASGASPTASAQSKKDIQDKIETLNKAVSNSTSALNSATSYATDLKTLTNRNSDKGPFAVRLQNIDEILKTIVASDLREELKGRKSSVEHATTALSNANCDEASVGNDIAADCARAIDSGTKRAADLDSSMTTLGASLDGIGTYVKLGMSDARKELDQLESLWSSPNDDAPQDFIAGVSTYRASCSIAKNELTSSIFDSLNSLKADTSTSGDVGTALTALSTKLAAQAENIDEILTAIQNRANEAAQAVSTSITAVGATSTGSAQTSSDASDAATKARTSLRAIGIVLSAWPKLERSISSCDLVDLKKLQAKIQAVQDSEKALRDKLSILTDALVGDPNQFTEEAVPLFFYTEVEKLMRSLNERTEWAGGNGAAAAEAASQRELLFDAESRTEQARADVADLQFELAKLQEEKRQADAAADKLALLRQYAGKKKQDRDQDLSLANEELNKAQAESDADPTNATKQSRLQKAKEKQGTTRTRDDDAATKESDAKTNLSNAEAQQTAANNDKDSLTSRIDLATVKLKDAQRSMEGMQRNAHRAALTESDAFAAARDQTPYLEGPALSTSPDPVKRVIVRGYPDRNLILLRGKPDDIAVVRRIIEKFDVPAPQARITLWSFEISAETSKPFLWFNNHPVDRLNQATAIVDAFLSITRNKIADATTSLRENINDAVSEAGREGTLTQDACTPVQMPEWVNMQLLPSERARWRRFRFYSPDVLIQAGVNMASVYSFRNAVLPDPAATTTVGEALMVLALSCERNRKEVFEQVRKENLEPSYQIGKYKSQSLYSEKLGGETPEEKEKEKKKEKKTKKACLYGIAQVLGVETPCSTRLIPANTDEASRWERAKTQEQAVLESETSKFKDEVVVPEQPLSITSSDPCPDPVIDLNKSGENQSSPGYPRAPTAVFDFGHRFSPTVSSDGITDTQLELVRALRAGATKKIVDELKELLVQMLKTEGQYQQLKNNPSYPNLSRQDVRTCQMKSAELGSLYNRYNRIVAMRLGALYPDRYRDFLMLPGRDDYKARVRIAFEKKLLKPEETAPRVAAADEMLKRMSGRIEDDIDKEYIQPMLPVLRAAIAGQKLTVGIVQRTSVLATNRLKARVDPKGTYDLSVGEQQDLLASIGQLASIYTSAQTGGALAAFGSLNSLSQKPQQHIYGVTTGNKFEVTPIFDPSGQALRFKFDYVSNSLIRNPRGTIDPSMPSLRHTINTEVQLTNLEIREISRYESNAKLGIPTRYYGGIPILTDIPGLKPIPLIGWFVRRGGSNAEVQQSVIFGQTTIYPTIGSIVDLLQTGN